MLRKLLFGIAIMGAAVPVSGQTLPYQNTSLSVEERAADLCSRLTLEEKSLIMRNSSPAIERLGIPAFEWWSEALHGNARNGFATVFPITTGMAASWNDGLLFQIFDAIGDEQRVKNTQARHSGVMKKYQGTSVWTPNVNIYRDPRWGRGQETYGEDPYLTSRMGIAVVKGLQGPEGSKYYKNLACAKHFAVHSGPEWNRHSFNIENLPERDLWETYLPAFKALIQEGKVAEVMCAYQRIDGAPCCGNDRYERQILKNDLGFTGLIVSDCGAIRDFYMKGHHEVSKDSAEATARAILSGTDVECGGVYASLPEAVRRGEITEAQIDVSVRRLLEWRFRLGDFDPDEMVEWTKIPESKVACKEHRALAKEMADQTIVLLQNDGILPLSKNDNDIVIIGPNANDSIMLWGNYNGYPLSSPTILAGIRHYLPNVKYVNGIGYTKNEVLNSRYGEIYTPSGEQGLKATYWNNVNMSGTPVAEQVMRQPINLDNGGATAFAPGVNLENFSARYEGVFKPTRTEEVDFNVGADDMCRLIINGDTIINNWKGRNRIVSTTKTRKVEAGKEYRIQIDYVQNKDMAAMHFDLGTRLKMSDADILREVGDAKTVVFVGGITPLLEGEEMKVSDPGFKGGDRTTMELPQSQRDVVALLHKAGKKIVFVNCSGGAMGLLPESQSCQAVVQAWYGGEAGGIALAEALFGDVNPSGHLPLTFYKSDADLPDFLDYKMTNRTYRFFNGEPLYAFGHGLSYTTFDFGKPKYNAAKGTVTLTVKNTGKRDGATVAQVYIAKPGDNGGPKKTLRAYQRVNLKAGESKTLNISLPRSSFEWWDASTNTMRVVPGKYKVMTGETSVDSGLKSIDVTIK